MTITIDRFINKIILPITWSKFDVQSVDKISLRNMTLLITLQSAEIPNAFNQLSNIKVKVSRLNENCNIFNVNNFI